jgi:ABC-type branched-subunit amino acid transport system ATPase component
MSETKVLEVSGLRTGYDGVAVLEDVDFTVGEEVFAVLGANGAGKTTLLATLARLNPLMSGTVTFRGTDISRMRAYHSAGLGIGYVPQERGVFPDLTVLDNLRVGGMIGIVRCQSESKMSSRSSRTSSAG